MRPLSRAATVSRARAVRRAPFADELFDFFFDRETQAITATKMIILPVIGVGFVQGLGATTTLFPKDEKSECRFVSLSHLSWLIYRTT